MKRAFLTIALALVMALVMAPGAWAQPPTQDPNCTFENGKTTCTDSVFLYSDVLFSQVDWVLPMACPQQGGYGQMTAVTQYSRDVYETTTTIYKGKSNQVLSRESSITYGEQYYSGYVEYSCY